MVGDCVLGKILAKLNGDGAVVTVGAGTGAATVLVIVSASGAASFLHSNLMASKREPFLPLTLYILESAGQFHGAARVPPVPPTAPVNIPLAPFSCNLSTREPPLIEPHPENPRLLAKPENIDPPVPPMCGDFDPSLHPTEIPSIPLPARPLIDVTNEVPGHMYENAVPPVPPIVGDIVVI
jgi:hypothetical protein